MTISYAYTIAYVKDVRETLDFFKSAFGFEEKFFLETGEYGELETGTTCLAFASEGMIDFNKLELRKNDPSKPSAAIELCFIVEDLQAAFDHAVSCGAEVIHQPTPKPWGQNVGYLRDPNGLLIELADPMKTGA